MACLADAWVLAVGDSSLRLLSMGLLERMAGRVMPLEQAPSCLPAWRYLDGGPCTHSRNMPCVIDVVTPRGGRVTYVWSFGTVNGRWSYESAAAVAHALRSAAPRAPDLFLLQAGAWYPDRFYRFGVRSPKDMAAQSDAFLEGSLQLLHAFSNATACMWLGLHGSNITHATDDAGIPYRA